MKRICIIIIITCLTLAGNAQNPNFEWAKKCGGSNDESVSVITTDSDGNIYTTGSFLGTADFDPGTGEQNFTSAGQGDIFIQKLDTDGNLLWAKHMGGNLGDGGRSIVTDANGNVYTTGAFRGTVDFDPGPGVQNLNTGGRDIFIQKLDSAGNFVWVKQLGEEGSDTGESITTDAEGNVYTTGDFRGTADFNPGPGVQLLYSVGSSDIFIQKLDSDGNFIWAKKVGGTNIDEAESIHTDAEGNVYITGDFRETADFDPGSEVYHLTSAAESDIFIQKLDTDGNFIWAKQIGGDGNEHGKSIIDANGNVYTTGVFRETVDFDPGSDVYDLTPAGHLAVFIQKLDTDGNFVWAKQIDADDYLGGNSITTDVDGNAYITGYFADTVDFDPGPEVYNLTTPGTSDTYIQKLDTDGNLIWAKHMNTGYRTAGRSITTDADRNLYRAGVFYWTVDFDPGLNVQNLSSTGSGDDIFIQKFSQCTVTGTDIQTACNAYTWVDGNTYTTSNNTATHIVGASATGCDSLVTLDLTINNVSDLTTSVNGSTISANNSNATYQWIDCDNNTPISGATNQDFTATMNGNYAVELTENGCTETSDCILITTVSLINPLADKFVLSPNPTTGNFAIEFDNIQQNLNVRLFTVSGQLIMNKNFQNTNLIQLKINHPKGIYLLEVLDGLGNKATLKVVKQ